MSAPKTNANAKATTIAKTNGATLTLLACTPLWSSLSSRPHAT